MSVIRSVFRSMSKMGPSVVTKNIQAARQFRQQSPSQITQNSFESGKIVFNLWWQFLNIELEFFCLFCLALHFHHSLCVAWLFVSIPIFLFTIFLYYLLYVLFFYQLFVSNVIQIIFFLSFLILSCPSHNPFFLSDYLLLTFYFWFQNTRILNHCEPESGQLS